MFYKTGSLQVLGKTTTADWRKLIVDSSVRQDPNSVTAEKELPLELDTEKFAFYRARAVSAMEMHGPNQNGDAFSEEELVANYKSFVRRGIYVNHNSENVDASVGIIVDAIWHPQLKYVECLFAVEKDSSAHKEVESGKIKSVSMGAMVQRCECSYCGRESYTEDTYCSHLKGMLGKEIQGKKVYAINKGVNFYELSLVHVPADADAHILQRVASKQPSDWRAMLKQIEALPSTDKGASSMSTLAAPSAVHNFVKAALELLAAGTPPEIVATAALKAKAEELTAETPVATSVKPIETPAVAPEAPKVEAKTEEKPKEEAKKDEKKPEVKKAFQVTYNDEHVGSFETEAMAMPFAKTFEDMNGIKILKATVGGSPEVVYPKATGEATLTAEKADSTIPKISAPKEKTAMSELSIKLYEGANPETSFLVARKGRLRTAVSLAALTAAEGTTKEAAGKVEVLKEKTDNVLKDGGNSPQPSDNLKGLDGVDKSKQIKPDHTLKDGGDSSQPSDLVKKYASKAEGSISKLAKLWGTEVTYIGAAKAPVKEASKEVKKEAVLADKGNWAKEDETTRIDPREGSKENWAKEEVETTGKAAGSKGGEVKKYFAQYDSKSLAEGQPSKTWAKEDADRKIAALSKELGEVKAALETQQKKAAIAAKAGLVNAIVSMEKAADLLNPSSDAVLEIEETEGITHANAVAKAEAKLKLARIDKLNNLSEEALVEIKDTLNATAQRKATASTEETRTVTAGFVPAVYNEGATSSPEDRLSQMWDA